METGDDIVLALMDETRCFEVTEFSDESGVSIDQGGDLATESAEVASVTVTVESLREGGKFDTFDVGDVGTCSSANEKTKSGLAYGCMLSLDREDMYSFEALELERDLDRFWPGEEVIRLLRGFRMGEGMGDGVNGATVGSGRRRPKENLLRNVSFSGGGLGCASAFVDILSWANAYRAPRGYDICELMVSNDRFGGSCERADSPLGRLVE